MDTKLLKKALEKIETKNDLRKFHNFIVDIKRTGLRIVPIYVNGEMVSLVGVE